MSLLEDVALLAEQGPVLQEGLCWQTMPRVLMLLWHLEIAIDAFEKDDAETFVRSLRQIRQMMVAP